MHGPSATALSLNVVSPRYEGVTLPTWINAVCDEGGCKWIDASGVMVTDDNGGTSIRLSVVNRHKTLPFDVDLMLFGSGESQHY